jgi:TctA family transporter
MESDLDGHNAAIASRVVDRGVSRPHRAFGTDDQERVVAPASPRVANGTIAVRPLVPLGTLLLEAPAVGG